MAGYFHHDAFVYVFHDPAILRTYHGEGSWESEELLRDLAEMATTLAILGEIRTRVGMSLTDKASLIQAGHPAEAATRLTPLAGSNVKV